MKTAPSLRLSQTLGRGPFGARAGDAGHGGRPAEGPSNSKGTFRAIFKVDSVGKAVEAGEVVVDVDRIGAGILGIPVAVKGISIDGWKLPAAVTPLAPIVAAKPMTVELALHCEASRNAPP